MNKRIKIVFTPTMVIAPEWVRQPMSRHKIELETTTEATVVRSFRGTKKPISGYKVSTTKLIEEIMKVDENAANYLKTNFSEKGDCEIFFEGNCCLLLE